MQITEQQYWSLPEELQQHFMIDCMPEVEEGYEKAFYCPKVSRKERHVGFESTYTTGDAMRELGGEYKVIETAAGQKSVPHDKDGNIIAQTTMQDMVEKSGVGNNHPTVKPVALMEYLIKLVTPPSTPTLQRKVLDPFMGSGSTGMAATALGHHFTGCEIDEKYVEIAKTRIEAWNKKDEVKSNSKIFDSLFGEPQEGDHNDQQ